MELLFYIRKHYGAYFDSVERMGVGVRMSFAAHPLSR